MEDFTPINSQEELNALIKDRLERERRKVEKEVRAEFNDYESLKSRLGEYETNVQSLTEKVTILETSNSDLATKLKASETASAKTRVCAEMGLPLEMCARINGNTEEEIKADAESLAKLFGKTQKAPPLYSSGENNQKPTESALRGLSEALKR